MASPLSPEMSDKPFDKRLDLGSSVADSGDNRFRVRTASGGKSPSVSGGGGGDGGSVGPSSTNFYGAGAAADPLGSAARRAARRALLLRAAKAMAEIGEAPRVIIPRFMPVRWRCALATRRYDAVFWLLI